MRELKIAYGNNRMSKLWTNGTITFDQHCQQLESTTRTLETVMEYAKFSKEERDQVKDKGGFVGGELRDGRRKRVNVICRSMLTADIDNADPGFIERFLKQCKYVACLYTTHSHTPSAPRVRIVVPLTRDVTPDEYQAIMRYFAAEWGIGLFDPCSYQPHQLMYWPTTPVDGEYLFRRVNGEWLDPDVFLGKHPEWRDCSRLPSSPRESLQKAKGSKTQEDPLTKSGVVGAFCRTYGIHDAIETFLPHVYAPSAIEGRYDYIPAESSGGLVIYEDKLAYSHHATDPAYGKEWNAFDLVRIHLFNDVDEKKSFNHMCELAANDKEVKLQIANERAAKVVADVDEENWESLLELNPNSTVPKNTLGNIQLILEHDPNLKGIVYNQQLDGMEIRGKVPWKHPSKYWRDADDAQLISYIEKRYCSFSQRNYQLAITKVADDRSYHPIREYLESLPEWDGQPRVDTLLIDYLGAEDTAYVRSVTRKTLCAAVRRVQSPGIKFDTMLVLNGPQGIGKSTLIARLAGEWFSDSLNLGDTKDKTAAEKLQGYWILEIGELAGLRKAEVETLRSFLSRQNDIYRAAFGRRATPHPRQCIFFGTTNAESGYLRDTTGNRRFWPVKTPGGGKKHSWDLTEAEVKQIWAEVLTFVQEGEVLHLSPEIEVLAKEEQRDAMESDEREGLVKDYLDKLLPDGWEDMELDERRAWLSGSKLPHFSKEGKVPRSKVCNMEIWCELLGRDQSGLKRADSNELTAILTKLGWVRLEKKERVKPYGPQVVYVPKQ